MRSSENTVRYRAPVACASAMARAGGLNDRTADPGGVFLFRFEEPGISLDNSRRAHQPASRVSARFPLSTGRTCVIRIALFDIQAFEVRNGDFAVILRTPGDGAASEVHGTGRILASGSCGAARSLSNGFN